MSAPLSAPLTGLRVVELGAMAAAPACTMILASWGADVIKIERPGGDPARRAGASAKIDASGRTFNPRFELHNRGKRSIVLDLDTEAGRDVSGRLVDHADVFVTNALPRSLRRFGLDAATVTARNPRLVYGQITSYGTDHPDEDRGSFDHGAFWAHTGVAAAFAPPDGPPPQPTGGMGDRSAGANLAGAVCAALIGRARTGRGSVVSTSLARTGVWLQGSDLADTLATGDAPPPRTRRATPTPLLNTFRDAGGRWFWLQVMHPRVDFVRLRAAIEDDRLDDDVFGGGDPAVLRANADAVVRLLDDVLGSRWLADLGPRLDAHGIRWAPVLRRGEVLDDPLVLASGAVVERPAGADDPLGPLALAGPCDVQSTGPIGRAPEPGEHTEEVLAELAAAELEPSNDAGGSVHG